MKNIVILFIVSFSLFSCNKYETEILGRKSFIQSLFPKDGRSKWQYTYRNEDFDFSLDLNNLENSSPFGTIINNLCYPFSNNNSNNNWYKNELYLAKNDVALELTYNETFNNIKLSYNGDDYNVSFDPHVISIPSITNFTDTTYIQREYLRIRYQNLNDNNFSFEENAIVDYRYTITLLNSQYVNDNLYENLVAVSIKIYNHTSPNANLQWFDYTYYFDYNEGLTGFEVNNQLYYLKN